MFDASTLQALAWAAAGCGFTWLMTTAGSAVVLFTGKDPERGKLAHHIFLGFAAGVMIAASVWSLLNPAIEQAEELGQIGWIPAAGGFLLGVAFLIALDSLLPHLHADEAEPEGIHTSWKRTTLLVSAVTLHNIPEGMSVGLLFAMASQTAGAAGEAYLGMAVALALGIGLQNFPEGAAVSLPLRREGFSRWKAFVVGACRASSSPCSAWSWCSRRGGSRPTCRGCSRSRPAPWSTWWWRSSSPRRTWASTPTWAPSASSRAS